MRNFRRFYYDVFSKYYDKFVALHSSDSQGELREFFAEKIPASTNHAILDLCTGTGSLLPYLQKRAGAKGLVVGIDFSLNMSRLSREKTKSFRNVFVIQADVTALPFADNVFDAVTCSYAFYELKGESQHQTLKEIVRVLKQGQPFLMMEHDLPKKFFIRILFYIRLLSMGARNAISILKHENRLLKKYFAGVEKIITPSGRSKIMKCSNYLEHGAHL
jgi:ubiquinone/menaquinone biosynthesis C-methylase UbiE